MNKLIWSEEQYSVGIKDIDLQHRKIFDLYNEALTCEECSLEKTIKILLDYTQSHFKEEEEFIIKLNPAAWSQHKKSHQDLMNQSWNYYEKARTDPKIDRNEFFNFLKNWITNHIRTEDKQDLSDTVS